jgi:hypothetical protein
VSHELGTAEHCFALCAALQERRDNGPQGEHKVNSRIRAGRILEEHGKGGRVLDVGGEEWYHEFLTSCECESCNLPEDMHTMEREGYDGAMALHVLEHSPFPLLVLSRMVKAVNPGGWIYIHVPKPSGIWLHYEPHVTMMPVESWRKLFAILGLTVIHEEEGRFGRSKHSWEYRILAEVPWS